MDDHAERKYTSMRVCEMECARVSRRMSELPYSMHGVDDDDEWQTSNDVDVDCIAHSQRNIVRRSVGYPPRPQNT